MPSNGEQPRRSTERLAAIRESLARIVAPVREEVEQIDARLEEVEAERNDLLAARREAMAVIRASDPEARAKQQAGNAARAKARANGNAERGARFAQEAEEQIEQLLAAGYGAKGFTRTMLHHELKGDRDGPGPGPASIQHAMNSLVDRGVIRRDRVVKGGGMQYKLVERS